MKLKNTSVYLVAGWMLAACSGGGFQKTENGVVVEVKQQQPTDVRKVRLEVMGDVYKRQEVYRYGRSQYRHE